MEDKPKDQPSPFDAEACEVEQEQTSSEGDDEPPDTERPKRTQMQKPCGAGYYAFAMTAYWSSVHVAEVEQEDVKPCRTRCGISLGANPILLESLEGRTLCRRAACKMFLAQIT